VANVEIYTTPFCPYCQRAKGLLTRKKVSFTEIDVLTTPGARTQMVERSGGAKTVPQVFIDGKHLGDSDRLLALEKAGELDDLLGLAG
jgi:glutaredoxin 3